MNINGLWGKKKQYDTLLKNKIYKLEYTYLNKQTHHHEFKKFNQLIFLKKMPLFKVYGTIKVIESKYEPTHNTIMELHKIRPG